MRVPRHSRGFTYLNYFGRSLATSALATRVDIIQLDKTHQGRFIVSRFHHLPQFVLHTPSRVVRNPELVLERQGREAVLRLGEQVYGEKPSRQGQLGRLKEGTTLMSEV